MNNKPKLNNSEVYVGIDVHAKSYSVALIVDGESRKPISMPASPKDLIDYLDKRFGKNCSIQSVYEAGFSGFVLHRELENYGVHSLVVNPSSIETAANDRVKTDRKDSMKLALHLSQGRLDSIYIPTRKEELSRQSHRARAQLVKTRTSVRNMIRSKLRMFNLLTNESKGVLTILKVNQALEGADETVKTVVEALMDVWKNLNENIKKLESQMREESNEIDSKYRQLPGIGAIAARVLSSELGNMSRFPNKRSICSYVGLTPCEHSSGSKISKGRITRQGSSRIRAILTQAALVAIGKDEAIAAFYKKIISNTSSVQKAIVAVARKLLVFAHMMFKTGKSYETEKAMPATTGIVTG